MVTTEIWDSIHLIVGNSHKHDAIGVEFFHFLMSQHPNNCNILITFAVACQQCLRSDFSAGRFICVYPPNKFIQHDMGPGLTVPDEQPSYEQDLAHVIGHAIPTVLCSN